MSGVLGCAITMLRDAMMRLRLAKYAMLGRDGAGCWRLGGCSPIKSDDGVVRNQFQQRRRRAHEYECAHAGRQRRHMLAARGAELFAEFVFGHGRAL